MAIIGSLDSERRKGEFVALAHAEGGVQIESAAALFNVSTMTIRRDLIELDAEGKVQRVRGGAIAAPAPRPFRDRQLTRASTKKLIVRKAAALVPSRGTIALDASTTVSFLATALPPSPRKELIVCTNSVETFAQLRAKEGVQPVVSGGEPEPSTGSLVGPLALQTVQLLRFDLFLASAKALDGRGSSEVSLAEAEIKRAFVLSARETVLCVDSSKLDQQSVARAIASAEITTIVTELSPSDIRLSAYREFVELI